MASQNHPMAFSRRVNIDLVAVVIALTLAALIRFNVLPAISF
jgi:hypothetical protein